jgi:hypothetical protein
MGKHCIDGTDAASEIAVHRNNKLAKRAQFYIIHHKLHQASVT